MEKIKLDPGEYTGTYDATAGRICLDFANTFTSSNRNSDEPHDWLDTFANLVTWGRLVGALADEDARTLLQEAAAQPEEAQRILKGAIELRETIYRIFSAIASGRSPAAADLDSLNAALAQALPHLRVVQDGDVFTWSWADQEDALDSMLWPVARSAGDLLTSDELERVGECAGDDCGFLFLDMSRNHSRRWCDMGDCGNRAKARRHYRRQKESLST
jgi:predicted RNA-binding Zn ribbon-like protein